MDEGYTPLKDKEKDTMLNKARIQRDPEKERALRTSVDIDDLKNRRKKMKETYSDWRDDLREIYGAGTASMSPADKDIATNQKPKKSTDAAKEIGDKKVNNKVVINPPMKEAFEEIGGVILSLHEADMSGAPSIKNARPLKKTSVKYDSHMKVMAPTIKSEEHLTKQDLEKMQDDKDKKEARTPDNKPEVKENVADQMRVSQEYFKKRASRSPEEKAAEKEKHAKSRARISAMHKRPDPYKARAGESD